MRPLSISPDPHFGSLFRRNRRLVFPDLASHDRFFRRDFPSFSDFDRRFNRTRNFVRAMFLLVGLGIAGTIGTNLYLGYTGRPSPEATVGRVEQFGITTAYVTREADGRYAVINMAGLKLGSLDEDGRAYNIMGGLVGHVGDDGRLYKIKTGEQGIETEVTVGFIDREGNVQGYGLSRLDGEKRVSIPGLNWKQNGAVAILSLF